jgi:nitroreductase
MTTGRRAISAAMALLLAASAAANDAPAIANQTGAQGWSRIHIADPYLRDTAERMLDAAATSLLRAECQMVMADFVDGRGQPLSAKLTELGVNARDYLGLIVFEDGTGHDACRGDGILAYTAPGSRVIYLCGRNFLRSAERGPEEVKAVMIHEMLHSLGLGENPPTSKHITYRVRQRCWK